jgi:CheY-like chemotaxis protein
MPMESKERPAPKTVLNRTMPIRVIVVDDDHGCVTTVYNMLERLGYDVAAANCGLAAIHCFRKYRYDLVVTALSMPNMDGHTLAGWIKQNFEKAQVIVMAESNLPELREYKDNRSVDAWLFKPINVDQMSNVLSKIIHIEN